MIDRKIFIIGILFALIILYYFGFLKFPKAEEPKILIGNIFYNSRFYNFSNNMELPESFEINGKARGTWFFEASLPIIVKDSQNKELGVFLAQAQDDWMTENFVEFNAKIDLAGLGLRKGEKIYLIFKKDNPSGDPKFDDSQQFQIKIR